MKNHPFSREAADGARLNLRESILGRTLLRCFLAALVPLLLVLIVSYVYQASTLKRDAQARINFVGEQKLRLLNLFFDDCQGDVLVLSRTPALVRAAPELSAAVLQRGGFASERYRAASQLPFEHLRTVVTTCGYADALLVSPSGDVLLATTARPELGTNLRTGRHRDTELTRVIDAARVTMRPAISSFRIHPPTGRAAIFVAAPMMQGRALAGFAVLEINREAITALARDYAGLGATGDIELGELRGGQFMLLTPTRDNKLPAFQAMPWNDAKDAPIVLASQGKSGSGVMRDLRGRPSIAWWTYLPQLKWGLVVRMDRSEALAALAVRREMAWWTALVSVVFALAAAWLAARSIARPVQALDQGVRRIAGGDYEHRVGQEGHGEIGRLGRFFDQMIDGIKSVTASRDELSVEIEKRKAVEAEVRQLNADLDKRVSERTADLAQRSRQLAAEIEERLKTQQALADQLALVAGIVNAIPYPIFVKDAEARFLICNHAYEHAFGVESESLKGQTSLDLDFLPEEERIRFHDEDVAVIRDADQRSYELTIAFADEEEHPALYSVNGFRHEDGRPGGLIGLLVDITDHKRAERELTAARQAIEQANREKGDLMARLSETQAKLVAAIRAAEEAARKATRERDHLAGRLAETEEKLAESIRAAEEAAARQAFAAETIVVAREELAEPTGTPEGEPVESIITPAAESEIDPVMSTPDVKHSEPDRQASAEAEIDAPPAQEGAVDDLPQAELDAVVPIEPVEAGFTEPGPSPPGREQEKPAVQPTPEEPPAKPATRKSPRARKNAAPSPQQELFTLDAPQPVASTTSARGEAKVPATLPESAEDESESERADRSVRAKPSPAAEAAPEGFAALEGIDAADGLRRAGGNRKAYRSLLLKFRDSHGHGAGEIQTAVESGNHELAKRLVHTIKSASANIGAGEVCEAAKALEAVLQGQAQDEDEALLPRLDAALRRVVASIDELEPPTGAPSAPLSPPAPMKASEVPAPRPFDVKALRLSLWTLESLLRNADIDAQAELEALHPQVKGTAFEARFATLAREIAGERFESAVAELERIKTDLAG